MYLSRISLACSYVFASRRDAASNAAMSIPSDAATSAGSPRLGTVESIGDKLKSLSPPFARPVNANSTRSDVPFFGAKFAHTGLLKVSARRCRQVDSPHTPRVFTVSQNFFKVLNAGCERQQFDKPFVHKSSLPRPPSCKRPRQRSSSVLGSFSVHGFRRIGSSFLEFFLAYF
jgi:hypothetical protein